MTRSPAVSKTNVELVVVVGRVWSRPGELKVLTAIVSVTGSPVLFEFTRRTVEKFKRQTRHAEYDFLELFLRHELKYVLCTDGLDYFLHFALVCRNVIVDILHDLKEAIAVPFGGELVFYVADCVVEKIDHIILPSDDEELEIEREWVAGWNVRIEAVDVAEHSHDGLFIVVVQVKLLGLRLLRSLVSNSR